MSAFVRIVIVFAGVWMVPLAVDAQDLAPELAPLAAKYKADIAATEAQKAAALARVQQSYSIALDAAEKAATAAGNVDAVAAITKERAAAKSGLMAPTLPPELPKSLGPARKAYLDGATRCAADIVPKQRAANADYLRALGGLQPKAASNPELAKQIATEKERLLGNAAAVVSKPTGSSRSSVVNGTFDLTEADGRPKGWNIPSSDGVSFESARDGSNMILRVTATGKPREAWATQEIPMVPRAKSVSFQARIRGKLIESKPDDDNSGANVSARFIGPDSKLYGSWFVLNGGHDAGWKVQTKSFPVPKDAKGLKVFLGAQWVTGTFDFDDIEVEFR